MNCNCCGSESGYCNCCGAKECDCAKKGRTPWWKNGKSGLSSMNNRPAIETPEYEEGKKGQNHE
jgi:hypothetical protein